jgi:transcriptional regulator with XRE-family HTH domain
LGFAFAISFLNCDFYQLLVCRKIGIMNRLMASKPLHPVITKLKVWRTARVFSQSQTIRALVAGGLPIKLGTLQQWERARSSPQVVTAAALERFLLEHHEMPLPQKAPAPVVLRLKAWREAKNLSQAEAVAALVSAGVPAKLQTLQQWESERRSPPAITTAALERFLQEYPGTDQHSAGR